MHVELTNTACKSSDKCFYLPGGCGCAFGGGGFFMVVLEVTYVLVVVLILLVM